MRNSARKNLEISLMEERFAPILETFDGCAGVYARAGGMEEVNRIRLAPIISEWRGKVLDVGCGAGAFIEKYINDGMKVYTLDFSWGMILQTMTRFEGKSPAPEYVRGMAQHIPFADETFDGVTSINTLHNMPEAGDVFTAIKEMSRVLKPGGKLLVEFRNRNHPERMKVHRLHDKKELPQKVFCISETQNMLNEAGMRFINAVPLYGTTPGGASAGGLGDVWERIMRKGPEKAPRFAALAEKPGDGRR